MPLYRLDVQKTDSGQRYWTNSYVLELGGLDINDPAITTILDAEQAIHSDFIYLNKARLSTPAKGDDQFQVITLNRYGTRPTSPGELWPMFNTMRVDFSPAIGSPSRKYLRIGVRDGDTTGTQFTQNLINYVGQYYGQPLTALAAYVDVDGQALVAGNVSRDVQMRQLRRGSKRKNRPII